MGRWGKKTKELLSFPLHRTNGLKGKYFPTVQFLGIITYSFIIYKIESREKECVFFILMVFFRSLIMKLDNSLTVSISII